MKGHVVHFVETDFVPANLSLKYFKAYLKLQFTRRLLGKDKPHFQALYRAENWAFLLPKASLKYYIVPVSGYPNTQLYSHFGLQSVPSVMGTFSSEQELRKIQVFPVCISEVPQMKQPENTVKSNFDFTFLKKLFSVN